MLSRDVAIKGLKNPNKAVRYVISQIVNKTSASYINRHRATNIYDRDWDVAVILDACSYDLIESSNIDLPGELNSIYSVASMTGDWMERTFSHHGENTIYITPAPFSHKIKSEDFYILDEVWKYAFDDDMGTVPPRVVTDKAISYGRQKMNKKIIVHYMQPHFPAITNPELGGKIDPSGGWPDSIWKKLANDEISKSTVWNAYQDNLYKVMEEVNILIQNIDANKMVITADHGNAFGEYQTYGHPSGTGLSSVRRVPWINVGETRDTGKHKPTKYNKGEKGSVKEKLKSLGYL